MPFSFGGDGETLQQRGDMKPEQLDYAMSRISGMPKGYIKDRSRKPDVVSHKRVFSWLCRAFNVTTVDAGSYIGMDHSTIIHHQQMSLTRDEVDLYVKCLLNAPRIKPKHHPVRIV